jgi:beta-glucosidase
VTGPFVWGTTASSTGAEGAAPASDWARWERLGRVPASADGAGFGVDAADDAGQLAALGLRAHRLTLEWARLEPESGRRDMDEVERYRALLAAVRAAGLAVWVTLHHTSLPGWFADDERGFRDDRARRLHWPRHVDWCAETFGDLVDGWVPIEDPVGWAVRGHLLGSRPPFLRDRIVTTEAVDGALEATLLAARLLHGHGTPVMAVFGAPTLHRADDDAGPALREWEELLWDPWLGALRNGIVRVPGRAPREDPDWLTTVDVVGIAHDHPVGVRADGALAPWPAAGRRSLAGFVPVVDELVVAVHRVAEALPRRRLAVAAHGLPTEDDTWRVSFVEETVRAARGVSAEGVDLAGWFHDTAVDGYEWVRGFAAPRGLLTRDRRPKDSALRLGELLTEAEG